MSIHEHSNWEISYQSSQQIPYNFEYLNLEMIADFEENSPEKSSPSKKGWYLNCTLILLWVIIISLGLFSGLNLVKQSYPEIEKAVYREYLYFLNY